MVKTSHSFHKIWIIKGNIETSKIKGPFRLLSGVNKFRINMLELGLEIGV